MSTPIDWYYSPDDGQQVGPLSFEQIRDLALAGRLSPADLVWADGMPDWIPAERVIALFQPPQPPPLPAPPPAATTAAPAPPPPVAYFNPRTVDVADRVSRALRGYPPATGGLADWPLSDHHLFQLRETAAYRKPILQCASLFAALAVLYVILGAVAALSMLASATGPSAAYDAGFALGFGGVMIGLGVLATLARAATLRCRPWGPATFAVLFGVGIVINLGSCAVTLSTTGPRGPEVVVNLVSLALAVVFIFICVRAVQAIPRFLACPVWAQEALVYSEL
jgi:hypothetical protein